MKSPESIAGVIFSSDRARVLLIQRCDVPVWVLPGGGIEKGETPEQSIIREILEETGFHVKVERLVGAYSPINRLARHTHLYECAILGGEAKISNETRNVAFFLLSALPKLIPPPYREWITDAHAHLPPLQKKLQSVTYPILIKNLLLHPILVLRFLLARAGFAINTGPLCDKKRGDN